MTTCGGKDASEHLKQSYENLKNDQVAGIEFVESSEDLIRHVPQLKHARDISSWKGLWNKQAGWAHAHDALTLLAEEVTKLMRQTKSTADEMTGKSTGSSIYLGTNGTISGLAVSDGRLTGINVASTRPTSTFCAPALPLQLYYQSCPPSSGRNAGHLCISNRQKSRLTSIETCPSSIITNLASFSSQIPKQDGSKYVMRPRDTNSRSPLTQMALPTPSQDMPATIPKTGSQRKQKSPSGSL